MLMVSPSSGQGCPSTRPRLQPGQSSYSSSYSSSGAFLPVTTHPPARLEECSAVGPVCSWKRLASLSNAEPKPFSRRLLTLHTHSAVQEANNYLPSNMLNKETPKKKAFRTSRATYYFLQSRVGFLRVICLQVIDSGVL